MKNIISFTLGLVCLGFHISGQSGSNTSSETLHEIKKLKNPTRVLYLAAHPDDENTRLISWLVNEVGAETAYLSLTRGDGGQNLIGKELSAQLGVLRTQELMQAREIDGGRQFFSRAVDFGYSKTSKETLEKWGEQEVLSDVVWVIRKFRPDVIITRFPPDSRGGHGHHTASAELGIKAFDLAADETAFPDQLEYVDTWQPRRIYWNASTWWNRGLDSIAQNNPDYVVVDVGGYNALLGMSNNELASLSRTQHKSQGFGVSVSRGSQKEYLQYLAGERAVEGLFDGIDQSWERYNFKEGTPMLNKIISNYDPVAPYKSVEGLLKLREESKAISDEQQRKEFQQKIDRILSEVLGIHAEVLAQNEFLLENSNQDFQLEMINRSPLQVELEKLSIGGQNKELSAQLKPNEEYQEKIKVEIENTGLSQPYWLTGKYENLYPVEDQQLVGKPENDPTLSATVFLTINTGAKKSDPYELELEVPVTYKFSDRVEGEIIHNTFVVPAVTMTPDKGQMLFLNDEAKELELKFNFRTENEITVELVAPGFEVQPSTLTLSPSGEMMATAQVRVKPLADSQNATLDFMLEGKSLQSLERINYSHIDERIVLTSASVELKKINLKKKGTYVGYIPGAGDEVAEAIAQMGYEIVILNEKMIRSQDLSELKAIVAGIRAYNTQDWLPGVKSQLMEYVQNGGNYIVQYNTASRDLLSNDIGPKPFEISRERVTEEDAQVNFLLPENPLLNKPNKISETDFEGWVQERGLYFAGEWDEAYLTPLGWHDQGEPERKGGLLLMNYGKGAFMYTGISFFRELPAGVPGAYRLLANILSYRNPAITQSNEQ